MQFGPTLSLVRRLIWLAAAVVSLASCGGSSGPGGEHLTHAPSGRCVTASSGHEFCDETNQGGFDLASAYGNSKSTCRALGVDKVAKAWHTHSDPAAAALGFAGDFNGSATQAAYEGCLDGFG
jgi:hypothetical protein